MQRVVDFTRDISQVVAALDAIQASPAGIVDPGGTNLFGAVNFGLTELDKAMQLYAEQTNFGIVTTGTLVPCGAGCEYTPTGSTAAAIAVVRAASSAFTAT